MFQLLPVFLGLFDSTVQKLMNGFRDIFYELAYSNLSNMLSDLNEKVATISTELSTAPDAWQGGTIWELIVKIAEQVALPVAGTVFTFVVLWELISMLVQPNNLADIDFVSVLMKWLIKTIVAAWFISNALTICNCFFGIGASMVSKTTTVLNQQVTDNTQGSVLLKYLSDNYGDQDEDAESGDVSGLISLTVSTWFIDVIIKFMGILITIILYSRMISIYLHCAVAPLPMATVTNHHMSNIGIGYMKNVFALAMQAVLMMICVAIYGVLVANVFDPNTITLDPENGITAIKLLTKACWSKIKNNKYNNMKTNVLMPICVGLKLVLRLTEKVFDKSDNKLNYYNDPDKSYIRIMEFMPGLSIQDFNTILEKQGLAPLGTVSKDEK